MHLHSQEFTLTIYIQNPNRTSSIQNRNSPTPSQSVVSARCHFDLISDVGTWLLGSLQVYKLINNRLPNTIYYHFVPLNEILSSVLLVLMKTYGQALFYETLDTLFP